MKLKSILYVSIAAAASLSLSSCLDDDGEPTDVRPGYLSFVNAMADTTALDFYIGEKLDDSPIQYTGRYPASSYVQAAPYQYQLQVAFPDDTEPLFTGRLGVAQDAYYTIYVYNTNDEVKGIQVEDDLESPASGMAKVRFANLASDVPNVDITPEGETEPWFSDNKAGSVSKEYQEVEAGSYMLQITDTGSGDELATGTVSLEDSKVYTLWLGGIHEGTGQKALRLESIEHELPETTTPTR